MGKNNKGKMISSKSWLISSLVGSIGVLVAYIVVDGYVSDGRVDNAYSGNLAGWVSLASILVCVITLMAAIKLEGWARIIPITCLLISLVIAALTYFAYSFSSYGTY